jgi:hypothetical protein
LSKKLSAVLLTATVLLLGASPVSATNSAVATIQQYSDDLPKGPSGTIQSPRYAGEAINAGDLSIRLLIDAPETKALKVNDNTVVYADTDPGVDTSVTTVQNNGVATVETLTIIKNDTAPQKYGFALDLPEGTRLVKNDNEINAYDIIDSAGQMVGAVDAPWARDANGADVPITLSNDRDVVVLDVQHKERGFKYPIAADPKFKVVPGNWTNSLYLSRSTTKQLATALKVGSTAVNAIKVMPLQLRLIAVASLGYWKMKADEAAGKNQCLRVRYIRIGSVIKSTVGLYSDGSKHCHN